MMPAVLVERHPFGDNSWPDNLQRVVFLTAKASGYYNTKAS
ncbi:hypothetical protein [Enteractinococcus coprophilus]|nr:hypothetical protein [Enteractinococcus coprophilus]